MGTVAFTPNTDSTQRLRNDSDTEHNVMLGQAGCNQMLSESSSRCSKKRVELAKIHISISAKILELQIEKHKQHTNAKCS